MNPISITTIQNRGILRIKTAQIMFKEIYNLENVSVYCTDQGNSNMKCIPPTSLSNLKTKQQN